MQPNPVNSEKLANALTIVLDQITVGTKEKLSVQIEEESKKPINCIVNERTTTTEVNLRTMIYSRRISNDKSSGSKVLRKAAEGLTVVYPKQHFLHVLVEKPLVQMDLEETTEFHMKNVSTFMII